MMIYTTRLALAAALFLSACSAAEPGPAVETDTVYDAALAEKLGADEYGMHAYIFATLKTGPEDKNITDQTRRQELFAGHFSNMGRLAEEGVLVLAGPFGDAEPKRGLFIFDVDTIEEAEELVKTDPAIAAGIFVVEFDRYYGSAAIKQLNELHKKVQKTKVE